MDYADKLPPSPWYIFAPPPRYIFPPPLTLVAIPEITVNARADADTIAEAYAAPQSAPWRLPEPFLLYEGDADPAGVRILKAEGNTMAPELQPGDRLVVDTSRHWPTLGELFVLWDGNSIVIKRYERVWDSEPPTIRLHSTWPFPPALRLSRIQGPIPGQGVVGHTHSVTTISVHTRITQLNTDFPSPRLPRGVDLLIHVARSHCYPDYNDRLLRHFPS